MGLFERCISGLKGCKSRLRNYYFRMMGVRIGGYVWMRRIEIPRNYSDIELAGGVALDTGVVLLCSGDTGSQPKLRIGRATYINRFTMLDACLSLDIGCECAIGPGCYLTDHDHGFLFGSAPLQQALNAMPTKIGHRVWLGAHVVVLKGVTIGDGAVIGAGSVVTKSIPAGAVAVGVPARVIRSSVSADVSIGGQAIGGS